MGYTRAETNSFAEYQVSKEGFGAAVTGNINSTEEVSRLAQAGASHLPSGLQGMAGYEGYPSHLSEYPEFAGEFGGESTQQAAQIAIANMDKDPAGVTGLQGFDGFEGVEDDAFAGYGETTASIASQAQNAALDDDESGFDGYGGLGEGPEESFHTYFHQASMARTDTGVIRGLAKAVKAVPASTPAAIRKQYYDLAKEMLMRKKQTQLRHLDLQRAEIESNIGWLVNPALPQTGGFNAVLQKAVGRVGAKLAKGEKDQIKSQQAIAVGDRLKQDLRERHLLSGYGDSSDGKMTYIGLGLAGILAVGIAYYLYKGNQPAPAMKKRRRKRKK